MDDVTYTTGDVALRFDVERKTVRDWADKYFTEFLSDGASPGEGKTKQFTNADLTVFSLWATYRSQGKTVQDTVEALAQGERGVMPDDPITQEEKMLAVNRLAEKSLALQQENEILKAKIAEQESRIKVLQKNEVALDFYKEQWEITQKQLRETEIELALLKHQLNESEI